MAGAMKPMQSETLRGITAALTAHRLGAHDLAEALLDELDEHEVAPALVAVLLQLLTMVDRGLRPGVDGNEILRRLGLIAAGVTTHRGG